jgi:hypothetical protein
VAAGWAVEVIPRGGQGFSLRHTLYGTHPASHPAGTGGQSCLDVEPTTQLHVMPKLRIRGAIHPLFHALWWLDARGRNVMSENWTLQNFKITFSTRPKRKHWIWHLVPRSIQSSDFTASYNHDHLLLLLFKLLIAVSYPLSSWTIVCLMHFIFISLIWTYDYI